MSTSRKRKHSEISQEKEEDTATTSTAAERQNNDNSDKESSAKGAKKAKNRCGVCRKKVGITGFACRCGGLFCPKHRYMEEHECSYNYKERGAEEIKKNNPVVVREKINKI